MPYVFIKITPHMPLLKGKGVYYQLDDQFGQEPQVFHFTLDENNGFLKFKFQETEVGYNTVKSIMCDDMDRYNDYPFEISYFSLQYISIGGKGKYIIAIRFGIPELEWYFYGHGFLKKSDLRQKAPLTRLTEVQKLGKLSFFPLLIP